MLPVKPPTLNLILLHCTDMCYQLSHTRVVQQIQRQMSTHSLDTNKRPVPCLHILVSVTLLTLPLQHMSPSSSTVVTVREDVMKWTQAGNMCAYTVSNSSARFECGKHLCENGWWIRVLAHWHVKYNTVHMSQRQTDSNVTLSGLPMSCPT